METFKKNLPRIGVIAIAVLALVDRVSKWWAFNRLDHSWIFKPYIHLQLAINRGISWGMLATGKQLPFYAITVLLIIITGYLIWYAHDRAKHQCVIFGEMLVIMGSISNILDRLVYGGVIDFIVLSYGQWSWPVFNVADMAIVLGVIIMFFEHSWQCPAQS